MRFWLNDSSSNYVFHIEDNPEHVFLCPISYILSSDNVHPRVQIFMKELILILDDFVLQEKMRAQQSKFMASVKSSADEGLDATKAVQEDSVVGLESEDSEHVICSLCHDPKSKSPLSFLILLQVGWSLPGSCVKAY